MAHKRRSTIIAEELAWKEQKELLERERKIKEEKRRFLNPFFKISTSKLLILFLFLNCTAIELFTGWVTVQSIMLAYSTGMAVDFTPLITLIGSIVGEVIGFAIYSLKSMKENTVNGITYMKAQYELNNDSVG